MKRMLVCVVFLLGSLHACDGAHPGMCPPQLPSDAPCDSNCVGDDDCLVIEKCCKGSCSDRCTPTMIISESSYPNACPMPLCSEMCPPGQEYGTDGHGCMTCECVDVMANADDEGDTSGPRREDLLGLDRAASQRCEGDLVWNECGSPCTPMCNQTIPRCIRKCEPRCECPRHSPILHEGRCVTVDHCKANCPGGMEWTDCGNECTPSCWDREPDTCTGVCMPRCSCPDDMPLWDDVMHLCANDFTCPMFSQKEEESAFNFDGNDLQKLLAALRKFERLAKEA